MSSEMFEAFGDLCVIFWVAEESIFVLDFACCIFCSLMYLVGLAPCQSFVFFFPFGSIVADDCRLRGCQPCWDARLP